MAYRARDFLEPWEALPGGGATPDVFLVRLILHDWQDNEARKYVLSSPAPPRPSCSASCG